MRDTHTQFLVVDDHRLFLEGMRHLLKNYSDNTRVHTASSISEALRQIDNQSHYDLIFLDLELPGMNGFSLFDALRSRRIFTPTIVVSSSNDASTIRKCLSAGAIGFIHKNSSSEEMLDAINRVLAGDIVVPSSFHPQLEVINDKSAKPTLAPGEISELSDRQLEVLKLIAEGLSNKQISTVLSISEATVKYHMAILFKSLAVNNRTKCLIEASRLGLLPTTDA